MKQDRGQYFCLCTLFCIIYAALFHPSMATAQEVQTVEIQIELKNAESAEVLIGERVIGTAPTTLRLEPGTHTLSFKSEGFQIHQEEIEVNPLQPMILAIRFKPALTTVPEHTGPSGYLLTSYITGGVGGALLAGGLITNVLAYSERLAASYNDIFQIEAKDQVDASETKMNIAYVFYGVGGALAVTSIVCMLLDSEEKRTEDSEQTSYYWSPPRGIEF